MIHDSEIDTRTKRRIMRHSHRLSTPAIPQEIPLFWNPTPFPPTRHREYGTTYVTGLPRPEAPNAENGIPGPYEETAQVIPALSRAHSNSRNGA